MQLVVAPTAAQQIKKLNAGSCVQQGSRRDVSASKGRVSFDYFCYFRTKEPGRLCPSKLFARGIVLSRRNSLAESKGGQSYDDDAFSSR